MILLKSDVNGGGLTFLFMYHSPTPPPPSHRNAQMRKTAINHPPLPLFLECFASISKITSAHVPTGTLVLQDPHANDLDIHTPTKKTDFRNLKAGTRDN